MKLWTAIGDPQDSDTGVGGSDPSPPGRGGAGGSGAAAPTPITLSEDALIVPPGGKDPVSFKEWFGGFAPASEVKQLRDQLGRFGKAEDLIKRAETLDQQRKTRQSQPSSGQPAANPLDSLRTKPFLSGADAAGLIEQVQRGNFEPLYQWANAVNQVLGTMHKRLSSADETATSVREERFTQNLGRVIDTGLSKAQIAAQAPELAGAPAQALKEFASDVYYGWEPSEGQTREQYDQEFAERFAERFEGLRKAVRAYDQYQARVARERRIPGRGGQATPSQPGKRTFVTPRERARMFSAVAET